MKSITINLTDTQWSALQYIAEDPEDWFKGWATGRANIAAKDIVRLYTDDKIEKGESITPVGTDAIVKAAYDEKIIVTVATANLSADDKS